jgi:hypothetical protein
MRLALLLLVIACGCPAPKGTSGPATELKVEDIVARLTKARTDMTSFKADSTMDYWTQGKRLKAEVLVMGAVGAKVRAAALSPAGGNAMMEMACQGTTFTYVDYQNNCALAGPCDERSIAQFFSLALAPDDFLHLAVGTPPVLAGATGKAAIVNGHEQVELTSAEGSEKLTIDTSGNHFDVLAAELVGADGKQKWSVENGDFVDVGGHRVPGKTRFKTPNQQDLIVEWGDTKLREANVAYGDDKWKLDAPPGLAQCGQSNPKTP